MKQPGTQQKMTSSLLGVKYQGTRSLYGAWAQRQNKEQRKKTFHLLLLQKQTSFPKAGRNAETTKYKGFKFADSGAGQGQPDPGLGPYSGILRAFGDIQMKGLAISKATKAVD